MVDKVAALTQSTRWSILVPYEENRTRCPTTGDAGSLVQLLADPNLDESLAEARPWREFRWHVAVN